MTNPGLLFILLGQIEQWFRFKRWKARSVFLAWFSSVPLHIALAGSVVGQFITVHKQALCGHTVHSK